MSQIQNTDYGIVASFKIPPFSGSQPEMFPQFLTALTTGLASKGIPMPKRGVPWLTVDQSKYFENAEENYVLDQVDIDHDPVLASQGYVAGDLCLLIANRRSWEKDNNLAMLNKANACAILAGSVVPGSVAESTILAGKEQDDFPQMIFALVDRYQGNRLSVLLPFVIQTVTLLRATGKPVKATQTLDQLNKFQSGFFSILGSINQITTESESEHKFRLVRMYQLWNALINIVTLSVESVDKTLVLLFLERNIRECTIPPLEVNILELMTALRNLCDANVSTIPPNVNSTDVPDTHVLVAKMLYTQLTNESNKWKNKRKSDNTTSGGKKGKTDAEHRKPCSFCQKPFHTADNCFKNPNANPEAKAKGEAMRLKAASKVPPVNALVTTTTPMTADLNLAGMSSDISINILLDSGSDNLIFNKYHLHLFTNLKVYNCDITGIGGSITQSITHKGNILFMGTTIPALYSSDLSKSVISEYILTSIYNFKIVKESNYCIITNNNNNTSTTTYLDLAIKQYVLPIVLFEHNEECHDINLASVRPANQKNFMARSFWTCIYGTYSPYG